MAALRERGELESTVIIYTSDNGVSWGEPGLPVGLKGLPYEEAIRVPLVVRWEALPVAGYTEYGLVANVDPAPTIAAIARALTPPLDGRNLLPLLVAGKRSPREVVLEYLRGSLPSLVPSYCGLRGQRHTYVLYETGEEELYDLSTDPYELDNLARQERYLPLLGSLRARTARACLPPPPSFAFPILAYRQIPLPPALPRRSLQGAASQGDAIAAR